MNFPLYISRRLQLTSSSRKANTTGVVIAVAGVALAIMIMEITLAVVAGFKSGVTEKLTGFEGQISVLPAYNYNTGEQDQYLSISPSLVATIADVIPEAEISMKFRLPGMIKTNTDFAGVYFTARDSAHDFSFEKNCIVSGEFPDYTLEDNSSKIVISESTARSLRIGLEDKINVCFFVNDNVKMRRLQVAGIYDSGFAEYDGTVAYASLPTLQSIAGVDSTSVTEIELTGVTLSRAAKAAEDLQNRFLLEYRTGEAQEVYPVDNITHTGAVFMSWLALLDTNVVVIFVLMLCVAALTLVSSMFILILERIPTIGILRAMGASRGQVRHVFIYLAMKVVGIGMLLGNLLGIGIVLLQKNFHLIPLDAKMYYLHYVPVEISPLAFVLLNLGAVVVAWLILILPSSMAAWVSPAVTMRFD